MLFYLLLHHRTCSACNIGFYGNGAVCVKDPSYTMVGSLNDLATAMASVEPGELVTANLSIYVPQRMVYNFSVTFVFPSSSTEGLFVTNISFSVLNTGNLSSPDSFRLGQSIFSSYGPLSSVNDSYNISFNSIYNPNFIPMTSSDRILLQVSYNVGLSSAVVKGTNLSSSFTVVYPSLGSLHIAMATLKVVEPTLTLTKQSSAPAVLQAGDVIPFYVKISHADLSNGAAYALHLTEPSHPYYHVNQSSIVYNCPVCTGLNAAVDASGSISFSALIMPLGASISLNWTVYVTSIVHPGYNITDLSNLNVIYYSNIIAGHGAGRLYPPLQSGSVPLWWGIVPSVAFNVNLNSTSIPESILPNMDIQEEAIFFMTVTIPRGSVDTVLNIQLPAVAAGVAVEGYNVFLYSVPSGITIPSLSITGRSLLNSVGDIDNLQVSLGTVVRGVGSSGSFVVALTYYIRNAIFVTNGLNLTTSIGLKADTVQFTWPSFRFEVTVPFLTLTTYTMTPANVQYDDVVFNTIVINHVAGVSTAVAYKVEVVVTESTLFNVKNSSISCQTSCSGFNSSFGSGHVQFYISYIPLGNSTNITWSSIIGPLSLTRAKLTLSASVLGNYYTSPALGPYPGMLQTISSTSSVAVEYPSIAFQLVDTTIAGTSGSNLAPDESATYLFTITLHAFVTNLTATITLPSQLSWLNASVKSIYPGVTATALGSVGASATILNNVAVFDFGAISANITASGNITLLLDFYFPRNSSAVNGDRFIVDGLLEYDSYSISNSTKLTAVEPL